MREIKPNNITLQKKRYTFDILPPRQSCKIRNYYLFSRVELPKQLKMLSIFPPY
jgi:hypothetical protein